jgi:hypothetical protein
LKDESDKDFYKLYFAKPDSFLISILRERSTYRSEAVIAAGKLLSERGIDLETIKDQIEPSIEMREEFVEEVDVVKNPDLENYREELEERFQRGVDPESIRLALKEKGYNSFDMLEKEIETDENLKASRDGAWKKWVVAAGIIVIILRILRFLFRHSG